MERWVNFPSFMSVYKRYRLLICIKEDFRVTPSNILAERLLRGSEESFGCRRLVKYSLSTIINMNY